MVRVRTDAAGRVTKLYLYNNALTGSIPPALGNLIHLRVLHFAGNRELTGPIPADLGNLVNLEYMDLWDCALTGTIPVALGNLLSLQKLFLEQNELTGPIPVELGRLVNLRTLFLGSNGLTGPIPVELGNLVNLEELSLAWNELTGPIPVELGNLVSLKFLNLRINELVGPVPHELGNLVSLETLFLGRNWGLSGSLPPGLRLQYLRGLDTSFTQTCAPVSWRDWLATIEFTGRVCETSVTMDMAVVYTPQARAARGAQTRLRRRSTCILPRPTRPTRLVGSTIV